MTALALIVGAGAGLSASVARALAARGAKIALAARDTEKLTGLCGEIGATAHACDVGEAAEVDALFAAVETAHGHAPDFVLYNPSARERAPFVALTDEGVERALRICAYGAFLVAQRAARRMLPHGRGAIFFTGASAGVKGFAHSAPFAMGKFALRGLAQSMARELHPQGIHIAHFVIDGAIASARYAGKPDVPDSALDPDAIAQSYLGVLDQPRSAWAWEIELRPWVETF